MNASDQTAARQQQTLLCSMPLTSTLCVSTRTNSSIQGGSTRVVSSVTSTLKVACGTSFTYETLAAVPAPQAGPPQPASTMISAYREVYSSMTSPSTVQAVSTIVQLAPRFKTLYC